MSAICHGFVQNAWRKDICSNCFRLRDEHSVKSDLNHHRAAGLQQYNNINPSHLQQQHFDDSPDNSNINNKMNSQNHSISILVKNGDNHNNSGYKSPTPRYQSSSTSGIPRANSHLKYQHSLSGKPYFNSSTFSADSIKGKAGMNGGLSSKTSTTPEVIDVNIGGSNGGSKKSVTHPFRGGDNSKSESHLQINNNRISNNILNGSSTSSSAITPATSSSTVVSVNGSTATSEQQQQQKKNHTHYNNNHSSTNANSNNSSTTTSQTSSNRRNNSVSSSFAGAATTGSSSLAPCANGTIVSVLANGYTKSSSNQKTLGSISSSSSNGDVNTKKLAVSSSASVLSDSVSGVGGKYQKSNGSMMDTPDGDCSYGRVKGILKAVNGNLPRKLSVKFPKEVVEFIGYGDDEPVSDGDEEEEDDEDVMDPQDNASISELLATHSTSPEEKELHQQTIKNTNFNSIKSNLMGFAPIEIGPIVGCTGGKSMENSSKPLVSIGTFDSRKEPLRITRKSDANGEVDVVPVETKKPTTTIPSKISTEKSNAVGALFKNSATTIAKASVVTNSSKQQARSSNNNNANGEVVVSNKVAASTVTKNDVKINVMSGNDGVSTIEVNPEKFPITLTTEIPCKSAIASGSSTSQDTKIEGERIIVKPKPILKNTTAVTSSATSASLPNKNNNENNTDEDTIMNNGTNSCARSNNVEKSLSNLIILNSGSIASKRTSFLQEIISAEPVTVLTGQTSNGSGISSCENYYTPEEPVSLNMERDSLEASMHHLKLGPFKTYEITDNSSEFDDSLEDSGLDIGKTKVIENSSESDDNDNEKFGSNSSDSGNENDFTDSRADIPKGLYISVDDDEVVKGVGDDDEDGLAKQPKLSPDSVLFSSASETSNTGSAESIPECVNVQVIASVVKRQAPAPPAVLPELPSNNNHVTESIYANEFRQEICDLYDDASCYKKPEIMTEEMTATAAGVEDIDQQQPEVEEEVEEEESIYDDCNAISTITNHNANGKSVTGSYDFTNGTRTKLDTDSGADTTDRIPRHIDGIEFIGIRKIDSETHLNDAALSNGNNRHQRSVSPEVSGKHERSSSVSPKARRKVNHFFSTIGKRAGAAFGSSHSPLSGATGFMRQKSPSPGPVAIAHEYKRSLSQDEVSMTRTQEIYATLTPASLKFKGLAPVLQKLSRMDTTEGKDSEGSPKEKMFKKHKILPSIKKFLRMGSKDFPEGVDTSGRSYDFKTDLSATSSSSGELSSTSSPCASSESSSNPPSSLEDDVRNKITVSSPVMINSTMSPPPTPQCVPSHHQLPPPKPAPPTSRPPPPPPPRVHSLDLMHRVGQQVAANGPNGTIKPARPPPPVRSNRIAPSFVSVFAAGPNPEGEPVPQGPPSKPKRKASMNTHSTASAARSDGEPSLENHVSSLNIETLKLIAGQAPAKIQHQSSQLMGKRSGTPIRWSDFYLLNVEPLANGDGFAFYSARWEDDPCVLLLEEESNNSVIIHLSCVEICTTFVDNVPAEYVPWNVADYSNGGFDVRASISVLPPCMVTKVPDYISATTYPSTQKYYALLQALIYWGKGDMSDLFVFQQSTYDHQTGPAESELVYVVSVPSPRSFTRSSYSQVSSSSSSNEFEILLKQYLLQPCVTTPEDQQVLLRIISGSAQEVEAQVKAFLQVKLYGHRMKPDELDKLKRLRTEKVILQWLERERALCMKEAIERTLLRESEPISPMRKSFVEFLMIPDTSAKALLELVLDLNK